LCQKSALDSLCVEFFVLWGFVVVCVLGFVFGLVVLTS
jgi:hypothetical protein